MIVSHVCIQLLVLWLRSCIKFNKNKKIFLNDIDFHFQICYIEFADVHKIFGAQ